MFESIFSFDVWIKFCLSTEQCKKKSHVRHGLRSVTVCQPAAGSTCSYADIL